MKKKKKKISLVFYIGNNNRKYHEHNYGLNEKNKSIFVCDNPLDIIQGQRLLAIVNNIYLQDSLINP